MALHDFTLISVSWMLNQRVSSCNSEGAEVPDTGEYQRRGAETVFVFAEFMKAKNLLGPKVKVARRPDLELKFSDLTAEGRRFTRFALDKWMRSVDLAGMSKPVTAKGLERMWAKFETKTA